jgi:hypothetical protein
MQGGYLFIFNGVLSDRIYQPVISTRCTVSRIGRSFHGSAPFPGKHDNPQEFFGEPQTSLACPRGPFRALESPEVPSCSSYFLTVP